MGGSNVFRISKKEEVFFDLFGKAVENSCKAATLLEELVKNYTNVNEKIKVLEETEHECDKHVHKMKCSPTNSLHVLFGPLS